MTAFWERLCFGFSVAVGVVVVLVFFILALVIIGQGVEVAIQLTAERDNCLKQATNGYEIRECR